MNPMHDLQFQTRRHLLNTAGVGLGAMALQSLAPPLSLGSDADTVKGPHVDAKAKSVIYLHMAGSPSQLELFEHKPELKKFHNKECPQEYLEGKRFAFIRGVPKMLAGQFRFQQHGQSGQWISELLPHFAESRR